LPGIASKVKRAATSAMRPRPCDDDEVHEHQDREDDDADDEIALRDQPAEGLDDVAGRVRALIPRARISRVDARLSATRNIVEISSTVGNELNSSGFLMKTDVIKIRIEKVIENDSETSSSQAGRG